ncbi:hypothetical protein CASFOL_029402 [Castilleja foliolosa]|uniref:Uncharacterized protein n=1 Tax=Castilleja foliolosa TaxID=1961234 RepID=A0ABD3CAC8_9LAMI
MIIFCFAPQDKQRISEDLKLFFQPLWEKFLQFEEDIIRW